MYAKGANMEKNNLMLEMRKIAKERFLNICTEISEIIQKENKLLEKDIPDTFRFEADDEKGYFEWQISKGSKNPVKIQISGDILGVSGYSIALISIHAEAMSNGMDNTISLMKKISEGKNMTQIVSEIESEKKSNTSSDNTIEIKKEFKNGTTVVKISVPPNLTDLVKEKIEKTIEEEIKKKNPEDNSENNSEDTKKY
jgi:hypothetical protein